jgi:hypothetical protein
MASSAEVKNKCSCTPSPSVLLRGVGMTIACVGNGINYIANYGVGALID